MSPEGGDRRTSHMVQEWSTMTASVTCAVTSKVEGQSSKVMSSVCRMFMHCSTTKTSRNTKIGRTVVRTTADIPHQFQGQKVKGQCTSLGQDPK